MLDFLTCVNPVPAGNNVGEDGLPKGFAAESGMEHGMTPADSWQVMKRLAALHLGSDGIEALAEAFLDELLEISGAAEGQLLLASDLHILASRPVDCQERFSLGIALDAIADSAVHWEESPDARVACFPLIVDAGVIAVLLLGFPSAEPCPPERLAALEGLLPFVTLSISQRQLQAAILDRDSQLADLGARYDDAMQRAVTDGLTGLINHTHFKELLGLEVGRSKRYGNQLTMLVLDIDYFKKINDTYGHLMGDVVIRRIAQALKGQVRDCDLVARYGGEEFAVLLPQTDLKGAYIVAERIRQRVRDMVFQTEERDPIPAVTISVGVSQLRKPDTVTTFIERADQALYRAKHGGRNAVCCEDDTPVLSDIQERAQTQRVAFLTAVAEMATEVALKDAYRSDYADQLTALARTFGEAVGLSAHQQHDLIMAAGLHHIGKIALPVEILAKNDALDDKEWALVQAHPQLSQQLIGQIAGMGSVSEAILYHHERWDGKGYPYGLKGEQIPLISRVLSVIDCYIAMINDRPYRKAMSIEVAREAILEGRGTQFDPAIVDAFLGVLARAEKLSS